MTKKLSEDDEFYWKQHLEKVGAEVEMKYFDRLGSESDEHWTNDPTYFAALRPPNKRLLREERRARRR